MYTSFKHILFILFFYNTVAIIYAQRPVIVTTYAGTTQKGSDNGDTSTATFNVPSGITFDDYNNMYVGDENELIRKITPQGIVTTVGGSYSPKSIAVDKDGNIYVAQRDGSKIQKITPDGIYSIFAGSNTPGNQDGNGADASFSGISGMVIDRLSGNMFVAEFYNRKIRKITPDGAVTTFAGSGNSGNIDGIGTKVWFEALTSITIDQSGNLFVGSENSIRKITPDTVVTTLIYNYAHAGGLLIDNTTGDLYIAQSTNRQIVVMPANAPGSSMSFAGTGWQGSVDGTGSTATFNYPLGLAMSATGKIYVTDAYNNNIRKIRYADDYTLDSDFGNTDPTTDIRTVTASTFTVYPTPTVDILTVKLSSEKEQIIGVEIIDSKGIAIVTKKYTLGMDNQNVSLSVANVPSGIYFAKIYTNSFVYVQKIIIQK